jgi:hypothetical protein
MSNYLKVSIAINIIALFAVITLFHHFELKRRVIKYLFNVPTLRCLYDPNIVVMGDSRINTNWNKLMHRNDIVEIHGGEIEDLMLQINFVKKIKPKICLVMIGINDMFWLNTPKQAFENYKLLIKKLQSDDYKIVIQSLIYVCPVKLFFREQNQEVDKLNAMLKNYASNNGLIYFDINSSLSKDNALDTDYSTDGVHINHAGFELWKSKLIPLLNNLKI